MRRRLHVLSYFLCPLHRVLPGQAGTFSFFFFSPPFSPLFWGSGDMEPLPDSLPHIRGLNSRPDGTTLLLFSFFSLFFWGASLSVAAARTDFFPRWPDIRTGWRTLPWASPTPPLLPSEVRVLEGHSMRSFFPPPLSRRAMESHGFLLPFLDGA